MCRSKGGDDMDGNIIDDLLRRHLFRSVEVPVLSIHGTADEIVPFEQGRALFDLARELMI